MLKNRLFKNSNVDSELQLHKYKDKILLFKKQCEIFFAETLDKPIYTMCFSFIESYKNLLRYWST